MDNNDFLFLNYINYRCNLKFIHTSPNTPTSSLAKIVEFVNSLLDIKGRVVKSDKNMVVRHERECLLSEQFAERKSPYYCLLFPVSLFQAMYKGLLCELNPCARANDLEITKSRSDEYCEIITTIERDSRLL